MPTLINLFGIEDPGYYIGNDIFDEKTDGIAYLPNLDWKTDKCLYVNGSVVENYTGEEISEDYIAQKNDEVMQRLEINNFILHTNYFKKKESQK